VQILASGKKSFVGKVGRIASEEVVLHLITSKCMLILHIRLRSASSE